MGRASSQSTGFNFDDDAWGDVAPAAVAPVPDLKKMQQQPGINLSAPQANSVSHQQKFATYTPALTAQQTSIQPSLSATAEPSKPTVKVKAGLPKEDDFFAEFGL
jgi:hypothetical protein